MRIYNYMYMEVYLSIYLSISLSLYLSLSLYMYMYMYMTERVDYGKYVFAEARVRRPGVAPRGPNHGGPRSPR